MASYFQQIYMITSLSLFDAFCIFFTSYSRLCYIFIDTGINSHADKLVCACRGLLELHRQFQNLFEILWGGWRLYNTYIWAATLSVQMGTQWRGAGHFLVTKQHCHFPIFHVTISFQSLLCLYQQFVFTRAVHIRLHHELAGCVWGPLERIWLLCQGNTPSCVIMSC
jgi:hypothetical protein